MEDNLKLMFMVQDLDTQFIQEEISEELDEKFESEV